MIGVGEGAGVSGVTWWSMEAGGWILIVGVGAGKGVGSAEEDRGWILVFLRSVQVGVGSGGEVGCLSGVARWCV